MSAVFRTFLSNLPAGGGYCVECLSKMYGTPIRTISGYLRDGGILGEEAKCRNCDQHTETFRGPAV